MSGQVRVRMHGEVLRAALHLPAHIHFAAASMPDDHGREMVEFTFTGPDFPEVADGEDPPMAEPSITHIRERWEWDWGLPS